MRPPGCVGQLVRVVKHLHAAEFGGAWFVVTGDPHEQERIRALVAASVLAGCAWNTQPHCDLARNAGARARCPLTRTTLARTASAG